MDRQTPLAIAQRPYPEITHLIRNTCRHSSLHLEDGLRRFTDELGNEVHLTEERLRYLLRRHPEMAFQIHRFGETLGQPDARRASKSNPSVQTYYRLYSDLRDRNRYLWLVVKKDGRVAKSLTGYLSRRIK